MSNPLVSICLLTYNHVKYIKNSIDGVLSQNIDFPIEFIIADDCSTDGTRDILIEYEKNNKSLIKLILQEINIGMQKNAYDLLRKAQGKYVAYLEGDDYWIDNDKLKKQVNFLENNSDYGLVWTDVNFLHEKTKKIERAVFKNKILPRFDSVENILINKPFFAPPTWVYRKENLPAKFYKYCDITFPMIMEVMSTSKIKHIPDITANYRVMEESASHSKSMLKRYKFLKGVFEIQKDYLKKLKFDHSIENKMLEKHYTSALPYAVILGDQETIDASRIALEKNKVSGLKIKLVLIISDFYFGKKILSYIYNNNIIKKILNFVF